MWESVTYWDDDEIVLVEIIPETGHEESARCWCEPRVMMLCPTCESDGSGCWRCQGGELVEYEPHAGQPPWFIHNEDTHAQA